ncbi:MAG: hypothetical protein M3203_13920 [Actinomycetota bacterium]|nr:hypothetical protein [Actinomycetota bacterium]
MEQSLKAYVWARSLLSSLTVNDEAGEGVISTAIAVLIMAALGAVMWLGFNAIWEGASSKTTDQINQIGGS